MRTSSRFALVCLAGLTLSACGSVGPFTPTEQVNYKSSVRGDPLALPPDFSNVVLSPKYTTQHGQASATQYQAAINKAKQQSNKTTVLTPQKNMRILRSGDTRWLQLDQDPVQVYQLLKQFWAQEGFTLFREHPQTGIIETDWAENQAKLPGGLLQQALGKLVNLSGGSGERERFISRVERIDGHTEVFINHQRLVETPTDRDHNTFKWLPVKEDPHLNAIILSRFMHYLGSDLKTAQAAVEDAKPVAPQALLAQQVLTLPVSVDNAYRQIGNALIASGVTISQSDAKRYRYDILYLDTDTGEKRQGANVFSRLLGNHGNLSPKTYTLVLVPRGAQTLVEVAHKGQIEHSETARRILTVLHEQLQR